MTDLAHAPQTLNRIRHARVRCGACRLPRETRHDPRVRKSSYEPVPRGSTSLLLPRIRIDQRIKYILYSARYRAFRSRQPSNLDMRIAPLPRVRCLLACVTYLLTYLLDMRIASRSRGGTVAARPACRAAPRRRDAMRRRTNRWYYPVRAATPSDRIIRDRTSRACKSR